MILIWVFSPRGPSNMPAHMSGMEKENRLNDNLAVDLVRALDPELPDFAQRIIVRFEPRYASSEQWRVVRLFAIEVVARMRPRTPDITRRLMNIVSGFAAWVWATSGGQLTVESTFTDRNIARYVSGHLRGVSDTRRWDVNRQLATVAKSLAGVEVAQLTRPSFHGRGRIFTMDQIAQMHSWATSLSTDIKRQNACAILGLAAGAGLTSGEVAQVRVEHLSRTDDLLLVEVTARRRRTVPVLRQWTRTVTRAVGDRQEGLLFTGYRWQEYPPRAIQNFLTDNPAPIRPSLKDLRRGWVVTQLDAGVPVKVVAEAGGFASVAGLTAYTAYQRPITVSDHFAELAGAAR